MSKVFIEESTLAAIGDSIRDKTGKQDLISPLNMPTEIESIKGGNIIKTVSGTCPITLEDCAEGNLLDYKIYGNFSDTIYYGQNNEYLKYDYITMDQVVGENKAGFNSGIKWNQVNRIRLKIRHPGTDENDMIFAAKPSADNEVSSLTNPWISIGKKQLSSYNLQKFTSNAVISGEFNTVNITFTLPTVSNYIFIGTWNNNAYIKNNDFGFIEFYRDDNLVASLYPVKRVSDGVFGFYNNLSGDFITCSANANAFIGHMPEGDSVGDFNGMSYVIPIKINSQLVNISLPFQLTTGDYIDFENRVIIKDAAPTYFDLPKIPLIEGTNTFDIETIVKPSNVSLTYVKNVDFNTMQTVEGVLPLTVEGVGQKLEDYKIYGAEGGVGNNVGKNLFNKNAKDASNGYITGGFLTNANNKTTNGGFAASEYIPVKPNTSYYLVSGYSNGNPSICWYDENKTFISGTNIATGIKVSPDGAAYCRTSYVVSEEDKVILAESDVAIPYEPYGIYSFPITVNGELKNDIRLNIMSGLFSGDYIDFENRAVVKNGVASHIDLPEIYLQKGQNVISVDTTVKPSKMSVSYVSQGNAAVLKKAATEGEIVKNYYLSGYDGNEVAYSGWDISPYYILDGNYFLCETATNMQYSTLYDADKQPLKIVVKMFMERPENAKYLRFSQSSAAVANFNVKNFIGNIIDES